jgi:hypothetical protein
MRWCGVVARVQEMMWRVWWSAGDGVEGGWWSAGDGVERLVG